MGNTIHAFDFLEKPESWCDSPIYVLFGDERFLQLLVRRQLLESLSPGDEFSSVVIDGDSAQWADIADELSTLSLFSQQSARVVVVEPADDFVKMYRSELEELVKRPPAGHLVLVVSSWPANTKLYKSINTSGCQIHCGEPQTSRSRNKSRDAHRIAKWLAARAKTEHQLALTQTVARQLLDLVQWNLGRADQELAKLALFIKSGSKVTEQDVVDVVGGWLAQSIWDTAAAGASGRADDALKHLHKMLQAGEHPLALFGQLSWSLRRYGGVWEIISRQGRAGKKPDLSVALRQAGFRAWNDELAHADRHLKQLGRDRVKQFYRWLLETDLALKGSHSEPRRARLALETLFCRMSDQLAPNPTTAVRSSE